MRRSSLLLMAGLLVISTLVFSLVFAQPPDPAPKDMPDQLKLTDEQIKKIDEIQYNFKKTQIGLRADLKTSRLELHHLMMQKEPDQREISKLVDKIAETQKDLLKNNVDRKLAMKGVLTPEQFERFMQRRGERGRGMMGKEGRFTRRHRQDFCPRGDGPGFLKSI